jgi:hypothetical protein
LTSPLCPPPTMMASYFGFGTGLGSRSFFQR